MASEILLRVYPHLLFAYHGRTLLVTDRAGMISEGMEGLYEHDLRLLSRYRLLVNECVPKLDALSAVDPYSTLAYYVCPPTPEDAARLEDESSLVYEKDRQVVVRIARFVGQGMHEDVELTNH